MKTDDDRGPFGAWIKGERERLGWSIEKLVIELGAIAEPFSDSYLRGIEGGRRPSARVRRALASVFKSEPQGEAPPSTTMDALITALGSQTDAINRLVQRLDLDAAAREGIAEGTARAEAELKRRRQLAGSRDASRRPRPRGTRRGSPVESVGQ